MNADQLVALCAETIEKLGVLIEVRKLSDPELEIRSGLCRVGKRRILFIEHGLSQAARLEVMVGALASLDIEGIFVAPAIRELIDECKERSENDSNSIT